MTAQDRAELGRQIQELTQRVHALQMSVYSQSDPTANPRLHEQLAAEEEKLRQLKQELEDEKPAEDGNGDQQVDSPSRGRFLGRETTGLVVEPKLQLDPLPTGAYHLLDPLSDPLLTVDVENVSRDIRRVCVKTFIEGLSAQAVRTVEIKPRERATFSMQPTLFPEKATAINEVQRATLHVIVEDLDGKLESHDTYTITCLARTASFNTVRRPDTGKLVDLSHYYGAWVTPHVALVQERIRRAVELAPERQLLGYQGDPDGVTHQVRALYQSLREAEIVYVNSVIDYGAPAGMATQRTRLPRESLTARSANCIDGTVLLASLMEGVSLHPVIALVPGHAFVGWEVWQGSDEWSFLETTMIGSAEFDAACQSGQRQYDQFQKFNSNKVKIHKLVDLRSRGIWPME